MDSQTLIRHINNAHAANSIGDYEAALTHCRRALKQQPELVEALYNQGLALGGLGQTAKALDSHRRAATLSQQSPEALNAIGLELGKLGAQAEAEQCLNRALALAPGHALALSNKANLLQQQQRFGEAEKCLQQAIAQRPGFTPLLSNLGAVLNRQTRFAEAEGVLRQAVAHSPEQAEAWNNLANALAGQRKFGEAESAFQQAIAIAPDLQEAYANLGDIFREMRRYPEAYEIYSSLFKLNPRFDFLKGRLLYSQMQCCDWRQFEELRHSINQDVRKGRKVADPFGYQALAELPQDLRQCAETYALECFPPRAKNIQTANWPRHERIRVGYVSGEFHTQATAILMAGLYEQHDKSRFAIIAFDNGRSDGSALRGRLENAFDEIINISLLNDDEAAAAISAREIDILVNLNGYFGKGRQGVFARRPSPVQVNYLGFPGTLGAGYMDYLIADRHVIPEKETSAYVEKIVWLPDCYQANDSTRPRPGTTDTTRTAAGFPESGFVYCCFNNSYKITPHRFALWMAILQQVPGSVLWLLEDNATASTNLRSEACKHGIAAERLVFAPRVHQDEHLARHQLADLFIDSLPYNAHTTAADALWSGLPVLTQTGSTFPGRVASSLLQAIGLPELITHDDASYVALAVELANNPARLAAIRKTLAEQHDKAPLFDTRRFTHHIETAYATMYQRQQAGLPPEHFAVDS
ncbi:O-linked N-acetylglucosamine transferase, SPINDLY family protein [Ferribacterium limneticum]|uniref:O-linked N-acetylglucosamine transferase, SPINDLY family protein n=1 Tax=Ferribacterium limneticum TaxID=76259 RepID=UPI001CFBBD2E|nr:tetratricopeptide repeat protein [Ferribacterium limneticum]UCV27969.1 tetratricopeptide repeat protein [Ferribacterium limneticum]UCV31886.1 tetratricopeptide repeat protein [Ferribacterium limneticum]